MPVSHAESAASAEQSQPRKHLLPVTLAALGVVYGDIGTSPLYALHACFLSSNPVTPTPANVFGVLSLIFWALMIVISVKYLLFVMRADNRGEGGILALLALLRPQRSAQPLYRLLLPALGIFGAALLYGDSIITPAISVLSAVEGLEEARPELQAMVLPITVGVLVLLFLPQRYGTARIGAAFGPVMVIWFLTLAGLGISGIYQRPDVLGAVNPLHAIRFFYENGWTGWLVLGAVFLVVTGGEALYADMGHFGRRPIQLAWFTLVLPALLLNYFGQGALIINNPVEVSRPFYDLAPAWALYPLILLATLATIIASQAVISGAFSLTRQAVQLGYCPRVRINQTSPTDYGQIYVPNVNWLLMVAAVALVVSFGASDRLAAAYGVAVATTMLITTVLIAVLTRVRGHWGWTKVGLLLASFLVIDVAFFSANISKLHQGGWLPLLIGALVFLFMFTWQRGQQLAARRLLDETPPLDSFLTQLAAHPPLRVRGTAVFLCESLNKVPVMVLHHLKHNQILHEQAVFFSAISEDVPRVAKTEYLEVNRLEAGFFRVIARYGFMETADIPAALADCRQHGLLMEPMTTTFYIGRRILIPTRRQGGMVLWRKKLFILMAQNALRATAFYRIPPERVVEIGSQVEI